MADTSSPNLWNFIKSKSGKRLAFVFIISLLLGSFVGYSYGYASGTSYTLQWCASTALGLMKITDVTIDFNEAILIEMMARYGNRLNSLFSITGNKTEVQNASIY